MNLTDSLNEDKADVILLQGLIDIQNNVLKFSIDSSEEFL